MFLIFPTVYQQEELAASQFFSPLLNFPPGTWVREPIVEYNHTCSEYNHPVTIILWFETVAAEHSSIC